MCISVHIAVGSVAATLVFKWGFSDGWTKLYVYGRLFLCAACCLFHELLLPIPRKQKALQHVSTPLALWCGCNIEISGALFPPPTWSRSNFGGEGVAWWLTRLLGSGRRWWLWSSCRCWTSGGSQQCCIYMCHVHPGTWAWWVFAPVAAGHVMTEAGEGCSGAALGAGVAKICLIPTAPQSLGLCETVHKVSSKHKFTGWTTSF